jgi:hypothetical protein
MADAHGFQRRPVTLLHISRSSSELIGGGFTSPVSFDGFFHFTIGT